MKRKAKTPSFDRESLQGDAYKREEARRSDAHAQKVYSRYRRRFATRRLFERQNHRILSALRSYQRDTGLHLLDVGCGFGSFLQSAYHQGGIRAYGLELGLWNARTARKDLPASVGVCIGDAECLPFPSAAYDAVVLKGVLHHLGVPRRAMEEAYRVLRAGGVLCIFEGDPTSLYRQTVLRIADLLGVQHETTLFHHLSPREIVDLLRDVGFAEVEVRPISGLFVPVGLQGWAGRRLWQIMEGIEDHLQRVAPRLFRWHNLFLGVKPNGARTGR